MTEPKKPILHRSPERVQVKTRVEDGIQLWASRPWQPKERAKYCREVLNRNPFSGEV